MTIYTDGDCTDNQKEADPVHGDVLLIITGPQGFELHVAFAMNEDSSEISLRVLVPAIRLWQGNRAQASRCYEWRVWTSRCLLTKSRAAGCALLPERILRCRLAQRIFFTT